MDSIFEYLILLFFIFSIIQSIFSKRKKEKARKQGQPVEKTPKKAKKPEKPQDILEELFGIKIPKPEEAESADVKREPEPYSSRDSSDPNTWDPSAEYEDVPRSEPQMEKTGNKYEYGQDIDELIRKSRESLESLAEVKIEAADKEVISERLLKFRRMLRDPKKLQDFIIIQEVLNKPKAFGE